MKASDLGSCGCNFTKCRSHVVGEGFIRCLGHELIRLFFDHQAQRKLSRWPRALIRACFSDFKLSHPKTIPSRPPPLSHLPPAHSRSAGSSCSNRTCLKAPTEARALHLARRPEHPQAPRLVRGRPVAQAVAKRPLRLREQKVQPPPRARQGRRPHPGPAPLVQVPLLRIQLPAQGAPAPLEWQKGEREEERDLKGNRGTVLNKGQRRGGMVGSPRVPTQYLVACGSSSISPPAK